MQGIEIESLADALGPEAFPIECAKIVEHHGSTTIRHSNGNTQLRDVLDPFDVTVDSPKELQTLILAGVGMDAVGRTRYTDRGGATAEYSSWHGDTI